MTKGTGIANITCRVMKSVTRTSPIGGMSVIGAVTSLATGTAHTEDAAVKKRIAPGAARVAMALLASRQIGLGIGAMQ